MSDRRNRIYIVTFVATVATMYALMYAALILVDPYGTGRFSPFERTVIATEDNNFANAARIRDPQFNAAIIGNSRSMRLSPERLNEMTGLSFVTLAMPGLDPQTQAAIAETFVRNHPDRALTLIWGLGDEWCRTHHEEIPFPRWLYDRSDIRYLLNLPSSDAMRLALRKVRILLNFDRERGTKDGYESDHPFWRKVPDIAALLAIQRPITAEAVDAPMPLIERLTKAVDSFGKNVTVTLLFQPIFANAVPVPGSDADARMTRCKHSVEELAFRRPNTEYVDMQVANPLTRDPLNFLDAAHFRDKIAGNVERAIAGSLRLVDN